MKPGAYIGFILYLTFTIVTESISVSSAHSITSIQGGELFIKKEGTAEFQIISDGEEVGIGDILYPMKGARVVLTCDSGKACIVPDGVPSGVSSICHPWRITTAMRGEVLPPRPGGNDPQIPYVLHPRMTYLLARRPVLRWNGVEGAESYTVRLHGSVMNVLWQKKVRSTEVQYAQSAPPLDWGIKYLLTVESDNGRSSHEDAGAHYGFEVIHEEDISNIRETGEKIAASAPALTPEERALAAAYFYKTKSLVSDAIGKLEAVVRQGTGTATLYRQIARLYAGVGLNLLSEDHYQKAIELSEAAGDRYGAAKTRAELADIKLMLGKNKEARELVDKAEKTYQQMGNFQGMREIEEWRKKDKTPPRPPVIEDIITPRG